MLERPPLSLYIHIPWCVRKCPYCDFNSHEFSEACPEDKYVDALVDDFNQEAKHVCGLDTELQSIFIGGGTPSLFAGQSYQRVLSQVEKIIPFSTDIEISLEANPGTVEAERFSAYREAGINRLSLGIQSFDDNCLKQLGRIHNSAEAEKAIRIARGAGFENFNLDLMHGLPGQTTELALNDLQRAIDFEPSHLSWYQLTIEPNTFFHSHPPALPTEGILEEIQVRGQTLLKANGFEQYEVSAFASEGNSSKHNLNYWSFGDYLGIGAGAHGKLTSVEQQKIFRTRKKKQPNHYLDAINGRQAERNEVSVDQRSVEYLMNALRLRTGFTVQEYENRTGLEFEQILKKVESLVEKGLMQLDKADRNSRVSTTDTGYRFLNSVLEEFL